MENDITRLVIADDHEIYRDGLKLLLRKAKHIEIVAEAEDGLQLVELATKLKPHVILTDIKMPRMDGIAATKHITRQHKDIAIIALSMFDEESLILEMIEAGARGYLLKNADKKEIIEAIDVVKDGEPYYCKDANLRLSKMVMKSTAKIIDPDARPELTTKEMEIITLICQEKNNKEIGDLLFVSPRTVERYKMNIMEKLKVKSIAGIIVYGIKNGLYNLTEE